MEENLFNAQKFLSAQEYIFEAALAEISSGRKRTHWSWYIFPQLKGLGHSALSREYAIENLEQAKSYLQNTLLRYRLIAISEALYAQSGSAREILGSPDDLKVRSCMTLFQQADPEIPIFQKVLDKFYGGKPDYRTLELLGKVNASGERKPSREEMAMVYQDTMKMIEENAILRETTAFSALNTVLYREEDEVESADNPQYDTTIQVTMNRSYQAAGLLRAKYPDERIAVLNFASATNPGGGVVTGARAQEESLCRCSTLYPCLNQPHLHEQYYRFHKQAGSCLYTDACLYTPDVMVIKKDINIPVRSPEEDWFKVDILTCAAPNLRYNPSLLNADEQYRLHVKRARKILSIAAAKRDTVLVLGAFGCGAFSNDPHAVAKAYSDVLKEYEGYFKCVEFAVFCAGTETENYRAFYQAFC
ncbi:MAG: TIGR02452 family protein [Clostridia bacterium]|nr:TIGR02452 family protein [Clostridia bacterium]